MNYPIPFFFFFFAAAAAKDLPELNASKTSDIASLPLKVKDASQSTSDSKGSLHIPTSECNPASSDVPPKASTPTADNPSCEEYTIFNRVLYLGAASISSACTQTEIFHNMAILCSQVKELAIEVSLSVPSHSEGHVM